MVMDILDRIMQQVESLEQLTSEASKVAEEGATARSIKSACDSFVAKLTGLAGEDGWQKVSAVHQRVEVATGIAQSIAVALGVASGADRTDGDKLARALGMACEQSWIEGDARTRAESVVAAWNETAPKGKGSGSGRASNGDARKDLPFPVRVKCESHDWSAVQTTTKNSLRWAAILHHEKDHGHKPERGEAVHQGLTEAIDAVVNGAMHAQGGGYLVDNAS